MAVWGSAKCLNVASQLATPTNNLARTGRRTKLQPSEALVRKLGPPGRGGPGGPDGPGGQGGPQGQGQGRRAAPQLPLLYATWSPSGHSLAYVFSNNIFYRKSPESEDVAITTTGALRSRGRDTNQTTVWDPLGLSLFFFISSLDPWVNLGI